MAVCALILNSRLNTLGVCAKLMLKLPRHTYLSDMKFEVIPTAPSGRGSWILGELLSSTKHLNKAGVLQEVSPQVDTLVQHLTRGNEMEHLKALLNKAIKRISEDQM